MTTALITVETTNELVKTQMHGSLQRSEQDVVGPSSILSGNGLSVDEETVACLVLIFQSAASNMLSEDAWWLTMHYAKDRAVALGIPKERVEEIFERLSQVQGRIRKQNPMIGMF